MGLRDSKQIARIVIDPVDHDVVYVAALGDLWKGGGERGIYKTTDGGLTWTQVLDAGPDAGGTELVMDPSNNKVLYAATYQRRRASWGMNGGGPDSGIWKTTDAGRTWTQLTKGLPAGPLGRIGLDVFRKNPSIVYARIEHDKEGGVYRSDDAGASWTQDERHQSAADVLQPDPDRSRQRQPGLRARHAAAALRRRRQDLPATTARRRSTWTSTRCGSTRTTRDHLMIGGDGGVGHHATTGARPDVWLPHLPVGQFYHVGYDMQDAVQRLRRAAGQQLLVRAQRGALAGRHRQRRLVRGPGRRRLRRR